MNPYWNRSFGSPLGVRLDGRIRSAWYAITNRRLNAIIATYSQEKAVYPPEMPSGYFLPRQTQEICHEATALYYSSFSHSKNQKERFHLALQCGAHPPFVFGREGHRQIAVQGEE